jgi:hypothetical protein
VNRNLKDFETNHDLLTIMAYLKNMDIEAVEKKHYLGDNFSPDEIGSLDMRLRFKPARIERFDLLPPVALPQLRTVEKPLAALADCVYGECTLLIKELMK